MIKEKQDAFEFICNEFTGIQRQRGLKMVLSEQQLSDKETTKFFTNWLVKIKFSIKNQLNKYSDLDQLKNQINEKLDTDSKDIVTYANYIVELQNIKTQMDEINFQLFCLGNYTIYLIDTIEELNLFNSNNIATAFSIPEHIVINGMKKYKDDENGVIFNLLTSECAESTHISEDFNLIDTSLLPFYWALNMVYLNNNFLNYSFD